MGGPQPVDSRPLAVQSDPARPEQDPGLTGVLQRLRAPAGSSADRPGPGDGAMEACADPNDLPAIRPDQTACKRPTVVMRGCHMRALDKLTTPSGTSIGRQPSRTAPMAFLGVTNAAGDPPARTLRGVTVAPAPRRWNTGDKARPLPFARFRPLTQITPAFKPVAQRGNRVYSAGTDAWALNFSLTIIALGRSKASTKARSLATG